jgi:RNA polymerase sigma-70 factor (ECF subfamily)
MDEKEKELINMILAGETEAFTDLIFPYREKILTLAYRLTNNEQDALDIAQETFLRAFRYLRHYNFSYSFRHWLLQIAINEAKNILRRRHRENKAKINLAEILRQEKENQLAANFPPKPQPELISDLESYLKFLTLRERQVLILRDLEGLSIKETASLLRCSSLSVRVNLSRARNKIRQLWERKKSQGG